MIYDILGDSIVSFYEKPLCYDIPMTDKICRQYQYNGNGFASLQREIYV